jgi:hypothetical protein
MIVNFTGAKKYIPMFGGLGGSWSDLNSCREIIVGGLRAETIIFHE